MFNETFITDTLKKVRGARKEERKPDKDIPSTQRIHITGEKNLLKYNSQASCAA